MHFFHNLRLKYTEPRKSGIRFVFDALFLLVTQPSHHCVVPKIQFGLFRHIWIFTPKYLIFYAKIAKYSWIIHPKKYQMIEFSCQNWSYKTLKKGQTKNFEIPNFFFVILKNSKSSVKLGSKKSQKFYYKNNLLILAQKNQISFFEWNRRGSSEAKTESV